MKLIKIIILLMAGASVASSQGMSIFTDWFKKSYTSQVEYATDLLQKMVIDPNKPLPADYDQRVKELILQGANPNIGNETNNPLIVAATYNLADLARFLLTHGADPNYLPPATAFLPGVGAFGDPSALETAISKNNNVVIEALLEHGANPNRPDALLRWTPLMHAVSGSNPETVRTILTTKSQIPLDLTVIDNRGGTAFDFVKSRLDRANTPQEQHEAQEIAKIVNEYKKQRLP